jgi:hypothetical protein
VAPPPPGPSRDLNTPGRVVSNAIQSATGSHTAGEMAAGYLSVAVPFFKQRNPYLFLFPTALALATGGVSTSGAKVWQTWVWPLVLHIWRDRSFFTHCFSEQR